MIGFYGKMLRINLLSIVLVILFYPAHATAQNTGTRQTLLVMVDFNDIPSTYTAGSFQSLFFSLNTKSVTDYYNEASYGQLTITPATETYDTSNDGIIGWLRLNQNHPNCEKAFDPDACYQTFASSAIQSADPYVDFSFFDSNGDNAITPAELSIIIVVAGYEVAYQRIYPGVWAHAYQLSSSLTLDGKSIKDYAMFGEKHSNHQATIGVMAHELGHLMFGLPDLYDRDRSSKGIGNWSLMAGGSWNGPTNNEGSSPAHPDAWSKKKLYWVKPTFPASDKITIPQIETNKSIYQLCISTQGQEYFLLENRQKIGFDTYLPGDGLAIYHIDEAIGNNDNEWYPGCTTCTSHYKVALEQADGRWDLEKNINSGDNGDLYPGVTNKKSFNDSSIPGSKNYAGQTTSVSVTKISASNAMMTATVSPASTESFVILEGVSGIFPSAIAYDGTNYFVVGGDPDQRSGYFDIYGARVSPGGKVLDPQGILILSGANASNLSIAFDGNNYLVVWENEWDGGGVGGDIYGIFVSPSGEVLEPAGFPIITNNSQRTPSVAFDGTNYFVVWSDWSNTSNGLVIRGTRITPNGTVLDAGGILISPVARPIGAVNPSIAFNSNSGNYLVVWDIGGFGGPWPYGAYPAAGIYGAIVSPKGEVSGLIPIAISMWYGKGDPSVSFNPISNQFLVVYTDYRNYEINPLNFDIYGQLVNSDGTLSGSEIPIATGSIRQDIPSVAFGGNNYIAVWGEYSHKDADIYGARISPAGVVLDPTGIAVAATRRWENLPSIACNFACNCLVVDQFDGIYGRLISP